MTVPREHHDVCVLGAGLQGVCAALALRAEGRKVCLIDRLPEPMLRASRCNEGKIHLGFVYANDASLRTSRLMLQSALSFAPLLDEWAPGALDWSSLRSRPFTYLILEDSLLDQTALFDHYEKVQACFRELSAEGVNYLGLSPDRLWEPRRTPSFASKKVVAAAYTCEVSLNLERFRSRLLASLKEMPEIRFLPNRQIDEVHRKPNGFSVGGTDGSNQSWRISAESVVNCLWEGRLEIDSQMGFEPSRPWTFRLKYRVLGGLPRELDHLPSVTMVLGAYGDIVPMGRASYFSWYPVCRIGWVSDLRPPHDWDGPCRGRPDAGVCAQIPTQVFQQLDRIIPGVRRATASSIDAGVVFSWGNTDVDDLESEFHQRYDVGLYKNDGYFSINTGKLTCAPFFARQLARQL